MHKILLLLLVLSFQAVCISTTSAGIFGFGDEEAETFDTVRNVMSGRNLKATASNRTFFLETPLGTEMPITFYSDGTVKGKAGGVARYLSKRKTVHEDSGTWWIEGRSLCSKWTVWFDGDPHCLKIKKNGRKIRWWSNAGRKGEARLGPQTIRQARTINDLLEKYK